MTEQEDVFANNTSTLGCVRKKDIDKNESENLSNEANNPACQMLITSNKKEQEETHICIQIKWNACQLNKCRNEKPTFQDAQVKNLTHKKNWKEIYPNCQKGDISRKKVTAKKSENTRGKAG